MTKKKPTRYFKKTEDGMFKVTIQRIDGKTWDDPITGTKVGDLIELLHEFAEMLVASVRVPGESSMPE